MLFLFLALLLVAIFIAGYIYIEKQRKDTK